MNFKQLSNDPKVTRHRQYLKALSDVDKELEEETEPRRPGRAKLSMSGPSNMALDEAKQRRFKRIQDEERARRKQIVKEKYGEDF